MKIARLILCTCTLMIFAMCPGCLETVTDNFKDPGPEYEQRYRDNENLGFPLNRVTGHVPDATKDKGTDNMCWAMVACNQLTYAGYVVDEEMCVSTMLQEFGNDPGSTHQALGFYFKEYLNIKWSYPEVYDYALSGDGDLLKFIIWHIDQDVPVALSMANKDEDAIGHVVMVFGYWVNKAGDEMDLYLVDGDDNDHTAVMTVTMQEDDTWKITFGYHDFTLSYGLALFPATQ